MGIFSGSTGRDPQAQRDRMVERQIRRRGVEDPVVLRAMREVPRHLFVPHRDRGLAYADRALPIGEGQTISQPYIVARMTELLEPRTGERALEVGTGSGYQAAILAACEMEVFSVERIASLHDRAREALAAAGYLDRVHLRHADGSLGWPEEAPFPRIIVTAGAEALPDPLFDQMEAGGILVAPVGGVVTQHLRRFRKTEAGDVREERFEAARFVPLVRDEENGEP